MHTYARVSFVYRTVDLMYNTSLCFLSRNMHVVDGHVHLNVWTALELFHSRLDLDVTLCQLR